ncbi:hypothetical protein [Litorilituus sediminis]|uniref:hypothetical protein n=1 Tax=Litorilituus sediminis TaxID=718192 RepID=UPI001B87CE3C|nr:hypothetical protein [Litorilituus sediminis]
MFNQDSSDKKSTQQRITSEQIEQHADFEEYLAQQARQVQDEEVPHWNRAAAFEQCMSEQTVIEKVQTGIKSLWVMPVVSMACSLVAVVALMPFLAPSSKMDEQTIAALVEQGVQQQIASKVDDMVAIKLREFAAEQQVILANYRADMLTQQQSSNLELASYILTASRQERKEDMADFISFINAQRKDEQLMQKIKFQQLQQEISLQKLNYATYNGLPATEQPAGLDKQMPAQGLIKQPLDKS